MSHSASIATMNEAAGSALNFYTAGDTERFRYALSDRRLTPEEVFLVAMVERAALDAQSESAKIRDEAVDWFTAPPNGVCSFHTICAHFSWDAAALRDQVMRGLRNGRRVRVRAHGGTSANQRVTGRRDRRRTPAGQAKWSNLRGQS